MTFNFEEMKTLVLVVLIENPNFKYILRMLGCPKLSIIHLG